jgi:DNA polymerase-4
MHGVGNKTAEKLTNIGIHTIGDLAKGNEIQLKTLLGINGVRLKERANGMDQRPVDPESIEEFKSIGNSTTLPRDISNQQELFHVLESLAETVSVRIKRKNVLAATLGITIRYKDRRTITRSRKLANPVNHKDDIAAFAKQLFLKSWNGDAIRLLGITGYDLVEQDQAFKQLDIFSYEHDAKKEPLLKTLSGLREKYGKNIIEIAGTHNVDPGHKIGTGTSFNKDFLRSFPQKKEEEE